MCSVCSHRVNLWEPSKLSQLKALRARIREIEGRPAVLTRRHRTGLSQVDEVLGGLPRPGIVALLGSRGTGALRLLLGLMAAHTVSQRGVWIDVPGRLYPPTAWAMGVEADRLLVVRPPEDRAGWAVERVARSGCFGMVAVSLPASMEGFGARWAQGSVGACTLCGGGAAASQSPGRSSPRDA